MVRGEETVFSEVDAKNPWWIIFGLYWGIHMAWKGADPMYVGWSLHLSPGSVLFYLGFGLTLLLMVMCGFSWTYSLIAWNRKSLLVALAVTIPCVVITYVLWPAGHGEYR